MRFSERYGFKPIKSLIQKDSIDDDLKNKLWNALTIYCWDKIGKGFAYSYNRGFLENLWHNYFRQPIDTLGYHWYTIKEGLRSYFFGCQWYEIYDFLEFIAKNSPSYFDKDDFESCTCS